MWRWFKFGKTTGESVPMNDISEMVTSPAGVTMIKLFEGFRNKAYKDSVGVPTIGYGFTKNVDMGDIITKQQASVRLKLELVEYEGYIKSYVTVPLQQEHFDALVSFVYNLGPSNFSGSTLLRKLNDKRYSEVPSEFRKWVYAGKKQLAGLVRRRAVESTLFNSGNDKL